MSKFSKMVRQKFLAGAVLVVILGWGLSSGAKAGGLDAFCSNEDILRLFVVCSITPYSELEKNLGNLKFEDWLRTADVGDWLRKAKTPADRKKVIRLLRDLFNLLTEECKWASGTHPSLDGIIDRCKVQAGKILRRNAEALVIIAGGN